MILAALALSGLSLGWKAAPVVGQLADALTTVRVVNAGGHELNPLLKGFSKEPAAMIGVKLGLGVGFALLGDKLAKSGHKGWGKFVCTIGAGSGVAGAVYNSK